MQPIRLKARLGSIVRSMLSAALIAGLAYQIGSAGIAAQLGSLSWEIVAIAVVILASSVLVVTPRWTTILRALSYRVRSSELVGSVFLGFLFNQLLPTAVGGDVIRAWRARQLGVPLNVAVHSVLLDRAAGVVVALLATVALLPLVNQPLPASALGWTVGLFVIAGAVGAIALYALGTMQTSPNRFIGTFQRALLGFNATAATVIGQPIAMLYIILCSVIGQIIAIATIALFAYDLGVNLTVIDIAVITLGSVLVSTIPISVAGWGVREGAMVVLFGFFGVPAEKSFAISVLFGASLLIASAPGAFTLVFGYGRTRTLDLPQGSGH